MPLLHKIQVQWRQIFLHCIIPQRQVRWGHGHGEVVLDVAAHLESSVATESLSVSLEIEVALVGSVEGAESDLVRAAGHVCYLPLLNGRGGGWEEPINLVTSLPRKRALRNIYSLILETRGLPTRGGACVLVELCMIPPKHSAFYHLRMRSR